MPVINIAWKRDGGEQVATKTEVSFLGGGGIYHYIIRKQTQDIQVMNFIRTCCLDWLGMDWFRLSWAGLGWIVRGGVGFGWLDLRGWVGLGWLGLGWVEVEVRTLEVVGVCC